MYACLNENPLFTQPQKMQPPSIWGKRLHPIFVYCTASVKKQMQKYVLFGCPGFVLQQDGANELLLQEYGLVQVCTNAKSCFLHYSTIRMECQVHFLGFRRKIGRCIFRAGTLNDSVIVCISHGNCIRLQQITVQNLTQENGMCTSIHLLYHTACNPA